MLYFLQSICYKKVLLVLLYCSIMSCVVMVENAVQGWGQRCNPECTAVYKPVRVQQSVQQYHTAVLLCVDITRYYFCITSMIVAVVTCRHRVDCCQAFSVLRSSAQKTKKQRKREREMAYHHHICWAKTNIMALGIRVAFVTRVEGAIGPPLPPAMQWLRHKHRR